MSAIDEMIKTISEKTISDFCREHDNRTFYSSNKIFHKTDNNASAFFPAAYRNVFKSFSICGYSETLNLFVFLIRLDSGKDLAERSCRRLQFDYAKTILKKDHGNYLFHDALTNWLHGSIPFELARAIFVFADEHGRFRFSLVENLDTKEESPKRFRRYTFYVDQKASNRTFRDRMNGKWTSFDEVKKAFSVERLSDEFFDEYKKIYLRFVEYATGKTEIMNQFSIFGDGEKAFRDYVKKMMGRLVFLQFLQKKGWLGVPAGEPWGNGDKEYMKNLFKRKTSAIQQDFLETVLEPLFFDSLNTDRSMNGDIAADVLSLESGKRIRIPYLNGGLFEKDTLDQTKVQFPAEYFAGLFETFERFNFTVDENDPNDAEIGVDPEMLGRIFENLLEDNKDKGAFYTPKEIVNYMCQESLIQYLGDTEENRKLVTELDASGIPDGKKNELIEKLKSVKICDPAIGSGAFPMGMLNLLYRIRINLGNVEYSSSGILKAKKEIIQNNIYGVDIEPGAVDIARLRFWLSIVVDEDTPTPLPNFDYKIMQGNSLLEQYNGVDLKLDLRPENKKERKKNKAIVEQQMFFAWDDEVKAIEDLKSAMNSFFDPVPGSNKVALRNNIDLAVKNYIKTKCGNASNVNTTVDALNLNNKPFFLWSLYFADVFAKKEGFDIVIGNPPYVDSETMTRIDEKNGSNIRQMYHDLYSTCRGNWDLFIAFIEAGLSLGHDRSSLSFIVPNKLIAAKYADCARQNLSKNHLLEIRDYSSVDVFSGIGVYPCTFIAKKSSSSRIIKMIKMENKEKELFASNVLYSKFVSDSLWDKYFYSKEIVDLIIKISSFPRLSSHFTHISGAATVAEAYRIKEIVKNSNTENCVNCSKLINTGTIDKFAIQWGKQPIRYLGFAATKPVVMDCDLKRIAPNRYVQAKKPKAIIAGMSIELEAYYDDGSCLAGKSTTIILQNAQGEKGLKALVSVLNSKLISFWIRKNYNSLAMAGGYLNIGVKEISEIPLPEMSAQTIETLAGLCDQSQKGEQAAIKQIDSIIFDLYNLSQKEISIIDRPHGNTKPNSTSQNTENDLFNASAQTENDDDARE